jgi:hypothetical protein
MKTLMVATLATVLLMAGSIVAQDKASSSSPANGVAASSKALTVSGKVSNDGKTLLTDIDSEWTVGNPEVLKGHEGRLVTVKCYVDTEKNRIHVLSVKRADTGSSYAAKTADSAFRR